MQRNDKAVSTGTNLNLTDMSAIQYLLSRKEDEDMKGTIRTKQKCPVCDKAFTHIAKLGLICPEHKTVPSRYFIDLMWKGKRVKIYSHKSGRILDGYQIASETLEHIHYEIRNHHFDPAKYIKADVIKFRFKNLFTAWLNNKESDVRKNLLAPSTLKTYKSYSRNYYIPAFSNSDIRDIRTADIHEFNKKLPNKLSPKYRKCLIDGLENFVNEMFRLEIIERMPIFPDITLDTKPPVWTDRETQDSILSRIATDDKDIYVFLTRQGVRPGEARALKVRDFEFKHGVVLIQRTFSDDKLIERTKSHKATARMINPELLDMLQNLCADKLPDAFVFLNPRAGKPYSDNVLHRIWQKACEDAKINIDLYNASRHSVASQAATAGTPLLAIKGVLGHADIRTTMKYANTDLLSQKAVFTVPRLSPISKLPLKKSKK